MTNYPMKLTCTKCGATDEGTLHIEDSKPLTGEEMNQIEARWDASMHGSKIAFVVRETEAAHGQQNQHGRANQTQ